MRRPAAALASAALAGFLLAGPSVASAAAAAAPACDPVTTPGCALIDLLESAGVDVSTLEATLAQLQDLAEAQLAPAGAPRPAPAASEASDAPATSASASGPTAFGGVLSTTAAPSPGGIASAAVPDVPVGGTLELGPLALPTYSFTGTPATSAVELATEAAVAGLVAPAVHAAAATPQGPDGSRAMAAVMAVSVLLFAAGLLLDQLQKARVPIRL